MDLDFHNYDYINVDGNFIHKTAIIGDNVKMGQGNVIGPYCVLGDFGFIRKMKEMRGIVTLGNHNVVGIGVCIQGGEVGITEIRNHNLIMHHAIIGHNCSVGDHNEIGPRVTLLGHVIVGDYNKIKASSTVRNRVKVGSYNLIGMCSCVTSDVGSVDEVWGVPAKSQKRPR